MYLGLDASTQSLSAILIDTAQGEIIAEESVNFGAEFPEYGSANGFISPGKGVVTASPLMWLDALDLVLQRLCDKGLDLAKVRAICGAGQQHASVYLNSRFESVLRKLDATRSLSEQFASTLSRAQSPIWMDNSTAEECVEISNSVYPNKKVSELTGSVATQRFTGPQIRKFYKQSPEAYSQTTTIHLNSSFLASIIAGSSAPIDFGDGAGMNLMDIRTNEWNSEMLEATAPELSNKLPELKNSGSYISKISGYFVNKYGFCPNCDALSWTGDNPASLVGMGAATAGKVVISLGTSDTLFAAMPESKTDPNGFGHVFGNPIKGYMSLICFANGSLARESLKQQFNLSWEQFEELALTSKPLGNQGKLAVPLFTSEITPRLQQAGFKTNEWDPQDEPVATTLRALLEGQFSNMKLQSEWMQLEINEILLTGGASKNQAIAQTVADIFQAPVKRLEVSSSVGLGAAILAARSEGASYNTLVDTFCAPSAGTTLPQDGSAIYSSHLRDHSHFLESLENSLGY
ncbi:MAG: FGGY family carbohydrate kinase [Rubritalea sp.]|uniref:xylulokinase n=1 Tax=Rubritalea sp. TaxID=2109375 RepID=UPI003241BEE8